MKLRVAHKAKDFVPNLVDSLETLCAENPFFDSFLNDESVYKNAYIVGGYIRSVLNDENPRDLDLIVNVPTETLGSYVNRHFSNFKQNRLGGFKIFLKNLTVDTWSMDDNWAFRKKLVNPGEESKLVDSISKGTFFNYDSLVYHLSTGKYNVKNYNKCVKEGELDILQNKPVYKRRNPTKEANILRALFLKEKYELKFSDQVVAYIKEYIVYSEQAYQSPSVKLMETLDKYEKYKEFLNGSKIDELLCTGGRLHKDLTGKAEMPTKKLVFH